jgi:hypothetical protein
MALELKRETECNCRVLQNGKDQDSTGGLIHYKLRVNWLTVLLDQSKGRDIYLCVGLGL